jgi:Homeodomain
LAPRPSQLLRAVSVHGRPLGLTAASYAAINLPFTNPTIRHLSRIAMEYNNPFARPYSGESAMPLEHHDGHPDPFSRRPSQLQLMDEYLHQHGQFDLNEYHQTHMGQEDLEDCEILTRPRLTREQVEVLENQFQAHPKPNSNVKRQLAIQTNLPLPRVSVRTRCTLSF